MELWVIVTIMAAAVQTLRFSLQKRLKTLGFSTGGATFSRFVYAVPLALAGLLVLMAIHGYALPPFGGLFWLWVVMGGLAQIVATFCTVALFSERSFAVGIAFTKTETIQIALISSILLGERVSGIGLWAIVIGFIGVIFLSRPEGGWKQGGIFNRATVLGLAAGGLFGLSSIGYRGATLEIANDDALFRATLALFCVTSFQTIAMTLWLVWREPGQLSKVMQAWRQTLPVGVTGVLGSLGWFTAFALHNVAYVRSIGQIELIFSILVSTLIFREVPKPREIIGMGLLVVSIVMIVLLT